MGGCSAVQERRSGRGLAAVAPGCPAPGPPAVGVCAGAALLPGRFWGYLVCVGVRVKESGKGATGRGEGARSLTGAPGWFWKQENKLFLKQPDWFAIEGLCVRSVCLYIPEGCWGGGADGGPALSSPAPSLLVPQACGRN